MKLRKIVIFFYIFMLFGCSYFNFEKSVTIEKYNKYLIVNKQLNFDNVKSISNIQKLIINGVDYNINASLDVLNRGHNDYVYHLHVIEDKDEYDSFYVKDINYISYKEEKYQKKVLLNAYRNMSAKYLHTDFIEISITGIEEIKVDKGSINIKLNDAGVLEYFNDVYSNRNMYIQEPDYISGNVNISYIINNDNLKQVKVEGNIKYKNKETSINEDIILNDEKDFELPNDLEEYVK